MIFYFQPQYLAKNMHNDINDSNLPADKRNNPAWQEIKNMKPLIIILLFVSSLAMADPLRIGTLYFYPPFAEQDDEKGDFSGFDIDLMKEICKKINRECVFKGMNFVDLFPALDSGKIDLAIGAISITVKRKYKYLFSYLRIPEDLITDSGRHLITDSGVFDHFNDSRPALSLNRIRL